MDGFSEDQPESETTDVNLNSAVYKVRQAISSPEHFESLYLELSELAMASFKDSCRDWAKMSKLVEKRGNFSLSISTKIFRVRVTSTSFKILDRDRSAAIIGGEVASFYFKRENYEKAEIKLLAILEIYENDGWECLAQKIRQDLVELYKRAGLFHFSSTEREPYCPHGNA